MFKQLALGSFRSSIRPRLGNDTDTFASLGLSVTDESETSAEISADGWFRNSRSSIAAISTTTEMRNYC